MSFVAIYLRFQRAVAALFAICFRLRADSLLARAFPPFSPPLRPISARYWEIGEGTSDLMSDARSTVSTGFDWVSIFLDRVMQASLTR